MTAVLSDTISDSLAAAASRSAALEAQIARDASPFPRNAGTTPASRRCRTRSSRRQSGRAPEPYDPDGRPGRDPAERGPRHDAEVAMQQRSRNREQLEHAEADRGERDPRRAAHGRLDASPQQRQREAGECEERGIHDHDAGREPVGAVQPQPSSTYGPVSVDLSLKPLW